MLESKFVARIRERDIDLVIVEELSVSLEFREWFSSRVFGEPVYREKIGAWHSISDTSGETDIVFIFEALEGPRMAILIENKVDAPPQPQQGQRYRLRGENGLKEGYWEVFKTCVIAPDKYLGSAKHSESYDVEISYEEILAYFQSRRSRDERFAYKARVLLEGIEQNRRGYQPKYNEAITKFVADYFSFVSEEYPYLKMQEAKPRPSKSTWISFYPKTLPEKTSLVHQLTAGFVKAFFHGQAESIVALQEKYSVKMPVGASIDIAGKSVAISMEVPKIDPLTVTFSKQKNKVRQALQKVLLLEKVVSENSETDRFETEYAKLNPDIEQALADEGLNEIIQE